MNKEIFFSIIIPTYNRANLLKRSIGSVLKQDYSNFELIIIDDGSTDCTEETVNHFLEIDKRIVYYKKKNEERSIARNYGANKAQGDYINFLDSDDTLYSNHLSTAKARITNLNFPEIIHLGYDTKNESEEVIKIFSNPLKDTLASLLKGNFMSCNGVILRRDIALKFPFAKNPDFIIMEDWATWLKIGSHYIIHHIPEVTSTVYEHNQRSVLRSDKISFIRSRNMFMQYLFSDQEFSKKFGKYKKQLNANTYSYIALHLALQKKYKKDVIKYLVLALVSNPATILQRRFYACIKHLL